MLKINVQRACPICQHATDAELLHTQKFSLPHNHLLPDQYDIVSCAACGFVYVDTLFEQVVYDKYYTEMSKYDQHISENHDSVNQDRSAWIASFIPDRSASVIDIGCGNGLLLVELKKLGFSNLTGLDPSEKSVLNLANYGICGIQSSIFSVPKNKQFDCLILSGVLEHIRDVTSVMKTIRVLIKRFGKLFVCVPDASRYKDFDFVPFDFFNIEHINHFDEGALLNLGLEQGFDMISFSKTTITLSKTIQPVIYCVYENKGNPPSDLQSYPRQCVAEYIQRTQNGQNTGTIIKQLEETQEEIIIWGAGNLISRLLANTDLGKCNIVMIVDNDEHKQGTCLNGKIVSAPAAIRDQKMTSAILVGAAVYCDEIIDEIKRMKLNNVIITLNNNGVDV